MGIVLVWLAMCDLATRRRWLDRWFGFFYSWSDRVIAIYFTHWIIVGWGVGLVGFRALALGPVLLAMAAAVVATSYLSRFAVKLETSWWLRGRVEARAIGGRRRGSGGLRARPRGFQRQRRASRRRAAARSAGPPAGVLEAA